MIVYHPWSGIPHDPSNFSPHQGPVAMNAALGACRFGITESAPVKFEVGIIDKFPASITRGDPGMMFVTIQDDHLFYSYFFYVYSIIVHIFVFHTSPILYIASSSGLNLFKNISLQA